MTGACRWPGAAVAATVIAATTLPLAAGSVPASATGGYTVTATIGVGTFPQDVAVDPAAGTVYATNAGNGTVSVINADLPVPVAMVTSSQDPSTFGQKVIFTATIAPADGGTLIQTVARAPTALTVSFRTVHHDLTLTAKLTASGRRVCGQPVPFSIGNTAL